MARDEIGDQRETVADQAAGTGDDFRAHLRRQRPFGQALAQHGAAHRDIFMAPPKFIDQRHRPYHPSGAQPWQAISFGQRADRDHLFGAAPKRRRFGGAVGAFGAAEQIDHALLRFQIVEQQPHPLEILQRVQIFQQIRVSAHD